MGRAWLRAAGRIACACACAARACGGVSPAACVSRGSPSADFTELPTFATKTPEKTPFDRKSGQLGGVPGRQGEAGRGDTWPRMNVSDHGRAGRNIRIIRRLIHRVAHFCDENARKRPVRPQKWATRWGARPTGRCTGAQAARQDATGRGGSPARRGGTRRQPGADERQRSRARRSQHPHHPPCNSPSCPLLRRKRPKTPRSTAKVGNSVRGQIGKARQLKARRGRHDKARRYDGLEPST